MREDASVYLYAFLGGADAIVNTMDLLFKHVKVTGYWVSRDFHLMSREERQKEAATVRCANLSFHKTSKNVFSPKSVFFPNTIQSLTGCRRILAASQALDSSLDLPVN